MRRCIAEGRGCRSGVFFVEVVILRYKADTLIIHLLDLSIRVFCFILAYSWVILGFEHDLKLEFRSRHPMDSFDVKLPFLSSHGPPS